MVPYRKERHFVMWYVRFWANYHAWPLADRLRYGSHLSVLFSVLMVHVTLAARRRTLSRQTL